jgi:hypothetical protein
MSLLRYRRNPLEMPQNRFRIENLSIFGVKPSDFGGFPRDLL